MAIGAPASTPPAHGWPTSITPAQYTRDSFEGKMFVREYCVSEIFAAVLNSPKNANFPSPLISQHFFPPCLFFGHFCHCHSLPPPEIDVKINCFCLCAAQTDRISALVIPTCSYRSTEKNKRFNTTIGNMERRHSFSRRFSRATRGTHLVRSLFVKVKNMHKAGARSFRLFSDDEEEEEESGGRRRRRRERREKKKTKRAEKEEFSRLISWHN